MVLLATVVMQWLSHVRASVHALSLPTLCNQWGTNSKLTLITYANAARQLGFIAIAMPSMNLRIWNSYTACMEPTLANQNRGAKTRKMLSEFVKIFREWWMLLWTPSAHLWNYGHFSSFTWLHPWSLRLGFPSGITRTHCCHWICILCIPLSFFVLISANLSPRKVLSAWGASSALQKIACWTLKQNGSLLGRMFVWKSCFRRDCLLSISWSQSLVRIN